MTSRLYFVLLFVLAGAVALAGVGTGVAATPATQCAPAAAYPAAGTPIAFWSTEARCAIVPAGPGGVFGTENFGNKFPGEAAVYMGIVHAAIYDAAVAIEGGYRLYAPTPRAPAQTSPEAAIATAAYGTLIGLQPALGLNAGQLAILDGDYAAYLASVPDDTAKVNGISIGAEHRPGGARRPGERRPWVRDDAAGPQHAGTAAGRVAAERHGARARRLPTRDAAAALRRASQFRPGKPFRLTSRVYAVDFDQVKELGSAASASRTPDQTVQAAFWTDHDIRQWNDGLLGSRPTAASTSFRPRGCWRWRTSPAATAMIACFDAKYHYWFWRPYQAIHQADADGNPATLADPNWLPLGVTPNFPEYPSAHACHSGAVVKALESFFGTDRMPLSLDSRITHTTTSYDQLHEVVDDVDLARVLVGFHFRSSDLTGSNLGRRVGRYVTEHYFQPTG